MVTSSLLRHSVAALVASFDTLSFSLSSVSVRAVTFYLKFEYSFKSGGKSSYSNVMTSSNSKFTRQKRNRPFEVGRLVI